MLFKKEQPDPEINLVVTDLDLKDGGKGPSMQVLPVVPLPHCALRAKITAIYEERHVTAGREYYDESRQRVVFIHDVDQEHPRDIVGADDVSPFVWTIQLVPKGDGPDRKWVNRHALSAKYGEKGSWRLLVFSDYGRTVNLTHWVRTQPESALLSGYKFNWKQDMGLAVMKHSTDDCKEEAPRPVPENQ
jgi:hypothetical protein